jgi:type I restriction enzyme S subunit
MSLRPLGQVVEFRNEIIHPKDRPQGTATFVGLEHVESNTGLRIGSAQIRLEEMTGRRARFKAGDIVYGYLRPYLNKVWIAEFDGICSVTNTFSRCVLLQIEITSPTFLEARRF